MDAELHGPNRYLIVRGSFEKVRIYHGLCHDAAQCALVHRPLQDRRLSWTAAWSLKNAKCHFKTNG